MTMQMITAPPFPRGMTNGAFLQGSEVTFTIDPSTTEHPHEDLVAREHWFPDLDYGTRGTPQRSGGAVLCRACRNLTPVGPAGSMYILGKRLVYTGQSIGTAVSGKSYTALGGSKERGRVYGYVDSDNAIGYPTDEFLPANGCAPYDLFWVVLRGPATILTNMSQLAASIAIGGPIAAVTAAGSTGGTTGATSTGVGGRIGPTVYGSTGATAGTALIGILGYALSACSSTATNSSLLVNVNIY